MHFYTNVLVGNEMLFEHITRHFPTLHGPNVERKNLNFILGKDYIGFSSSIKDRIWSR